MPSGEAGGLLFTDDMACLRDGKKHAVAGNGQT
jgi:hypothetical protein